MTATRADLASLGRGAGRRQPAVSVRDPRRSRPDAGSHWPRSAVAVVLTAAVLVARPLPAWARPAAGTGQAPVAAGAPAPDLSDRAGPGIVTAGAVVLPRDAIGTYLWPAAGPVVATWEASANPYGPGHRGVDLAVAVGDPVAAMAGGVVGFAGVVVGRAWVSIDHPDGLRTTVGPLAVVAVSAGDPVRQGQVVGTAAATAHADARVLRTGRLHVSARVAGTYVDPVPLVGRLVATLLSPTTDIGSSAR